MMRGQKRPTQASSWILGREGFESHLSCHCFRTRSFGVRTSSERWFLKSSGFHVTSWDAQTSCVEGEPSALGPQPVDDLNAVLHLAENRMIRPAALGLLHDLLPGSLAAWKSRHSNLALSLHASASTGLRSAISTITFSTFI